MFDGVPHDQLHHFSRSTTSNSPSSSLPLSSFPLHHHHQHSQTTTNNNNNNNIISNNSLFDSFSHQLIFPLHHQHHEFLNHHHHQVLHHRSVVNGNNNNKDQALAAEIEPPCHADTWTNEEVLALLRIRSTVENCFPDFTWEHVSRKLAEVGFKIRSAKKCKEKFEEESRYFNINNCTKNNFRPLFLSELEELYNTQPNTPDHHNNAAIIIGPQIKIINHNPSDESVLAEQQQQHDSSSTKTDKVVIKANDDDKKKKKKKRKRRSCLDDNKERFEMFKGFCEGVVKKMMAQQEEMHSKLIDDMVKRDREKLEKEESWKRTEIERLNRELDVMAQERALAADRQAAIIDFFTKFTNKVNPDRTVVVDTSLVKKTVVITTVNDNDKPALSLANSSSSSSLLIHGSPTNNKNNNANASNDRAVGVVRQNPNPSHGENRPLDLGDIQSGKRWPRDEVLALINLRCSLYNNNNNGDTDDNNQVVNQQDHKEKESLLGNSKAVPLWERISQGMSEMGYERSAKRCKEKWENINKYFRKTKDVNKKRSVDSRTCPYFDQLSTLYNKGTLVNHHHNNNNPDDEDYHHLNHSSEEGLGVNHHHHRDVHVVGDQGERSETTTTIAVANNNNDNIVVVPSAFDFEF